MRSSVVLRLTSVLLLSSTGVLTGQDSSARPVTPPYRNRLLGVFDAQSGDAIVGARVTDVLNRVTALTTATGTVSLIFLLEGGSLVRIEKIGYQPTTITVEISPSDTIPFTILLTPVARTLPEVVVRDTAPNYLSPGLRAFEQRRQGGLGRFVAEAELRKHDTERMTNVVRRFPGLSIVCPRTGSRKGECYAISTRQTSSHVLGGGNCPLDVYIDGVPSVDNDLQKLSVTEYAGVEYYAGGAQLPPQFNRTGSSCGVLLFWSRER